MNDEFENKSKELENLAGKIRNAAEIFRDLKKYEKELSTVNANNERSIEELFYDFCEEFKNTDTSNPYLKDPYKGYELLSEILPAERKKVTKLENDYLTFESLIDEAVRKNIIEVSDLQDLEEIKKELCFFVESPKLYNRHVIAVCGRFSNGKSFFVNRLYEEEILPKSIYSSSAIPTYAMSSDNVTKKANTIINSNGQKITVSTEGLNAITKMFEKQYNLNFNHIIDRILIELPNTKTEYNNIAFLDTPGFNDTAATDQLTFNVASRADTVMWIMKSSKGTLPPTDINAIRQLTERERDGNFLFLLNVTKKEDWEKVLNGAEEKLCREFPKYFIKEESFFAYEVENDKIRELPRKRKGKFTLRKHLTGFNPSNKSFHSQIDNLFIKIKERYTVKLKTLEERRLQYNQLSTSLLKGDEKREHSDELNRLRNTVKRELGFVTDEEREMINFFENLKALTAKIDRELDPENKQNAIINSSEIKKAKSYRQKINDAIFLNKIIQPSERESTLIVSTSNLDDIALSSDIDTGSLFKIKKQKNGIISMNHVDTGKPVKIDGESFFRVEIIDDGWFVLRATDRLYVNLGADGKLYHKAVSLKNAWKFDLILEGVDCFEDKNGRKWLLRNAEKNEDSPEFYNKSDCNIEKLTVINKNNCVFSPELVTLEKHKLTELRIPVKSKIADLPENISAVVSLENEGGHDIASIEISGCVGDYHTEITYNTDSNTDSIHQYTAKYTDSEPCFIIKRYNKQWEFSAYRKHECKETIESSKELGVAEDLLPVKVKLALKQKYRQEEENHKCELYLGNIDILEGKIAGWEPADLKNSSIEAPQKKSINLLKGQIDSNGIYTVQFNHYEGDVAIKILGIQLVKNGKVVAKDFHEGRAGYPKNTNSNKYYLKVSDYKAKSDYKITPIFHQWDNAKSDPCGYGNIILFKSPFEKAVKYGRQVYIQNTSSQKYITSKPELSCNEKLHPKASRYEMIPVPEEAGKYIIKDLSKNRYVKVDSKNENRLSAMIKMKNHAEHFTLEAKNGPDNTYSLWDSKGNRIICDGTSNTLIAVEGDATEASLFKFHITV